MKSIYDSRQRLKFVFIFTAILIAIASLVVSDMLIKDLAQEERQKMEGWAEATRLTASKNTAVDLSLVLKILEGNTTIPVVLCNDKDSIMFVKNISFPENDVEEFKKVKVKELKSKNTIVIDMEDGTFQYVYYDDSVILKRLLIYPYAQLTVVFVFIVIAFLALASTKKAEQNKVWVGLSRNGSSVRNAYFVFDSLGGIPADKRYRFFSLERDGKRCEAFGNDCGAFFQDRFQSGPSPSGYQ